MCGRFLFVSSVAVTFRVFLTIGATQFDRFKKDCYSGKSLLGELP